MNTKLWAIAGIMAASGCLFPTETEQEQSQQDLNTSRQLWEDLDIQDYYIRQRKICFCVPAVTRLTELEVRDGIIVSWRDVETDEPVDPQLQSEFLTVIQLFDLVQDAIDRAAASIVTEYDSESGFPFDVSIDYEANVADEEVRYENVQLTFSSG